MKWCHCRESIKFPFEKMERYELLDDRHTSFMVLKCEKCGKLVFFPHVNFELAAMEGTAGTIVKISKFIIRWIKG